MMNQVLLVGRLVKTPDLFETENGKKGTFVTLAINRPFKNIDGEYDTDFLDCTLWTGIAENTAEYCKTGDVIGVRGRLQSKIVDNEDGSRYKRMEIIADKVTFLSSSRNNNSNEVEDVIDAQDTVEDIITNSDDISSKKEKKKKNN